ncbi:MAG TPA: protein kinase [Gemmataceae bacterium]|nr:protein kinase [Gemmataceae bacterium]
MNYDLLRVVRSSNDWLVWRGEHPASQARYLLKQPQPNADAHRLGERLAEEHAFFQPLQHPHLIRPRNWEPAGPCLVLDDVQCTLAELLEQEGRLAPDLTVNVLMQCLDALGYLHERRLGHGCVSPHTILVDPEGMIKFGEFIGYRFDEGTPPPPDHPMKYQAPEMLDGTLGNPGPASDLYCLGHTALELLLGGEYPLLFAGPGGNAADVQANWLGWHAHPGRELSNLAQSLPHVPPVLLDILARMVRKDPSQRGYRSAAEVRQALTATGLASQRPLPAFGEAPAPAAPEEPDPQPPRRRAKKSKPKLGASSRGRTLSLKWHEDGKEKTKKFPASQTVVVGRHPTCELHLEEEGVSRRHALLANQTNGQWWVYDLHSTQGTWHNGTSIRAAHLKQGDEIRFGDVSCGVEISRPKRSASRIGPFRLLGTIHQGHNGKLYRAVWPNNASYPVVAVRVFPSDFQFDEEQVRRFLRGIPQAAAFRHANLLRLFRGGSIRKGGKRRWFLAMEYMAGGSLRDRLAREGGLTGAETFAYAGDVLAGLTAISAQRLLHRNLRPSCILFDQQDRAKIGDFVMMRGDFVDSFQQVTRAGSVPAEHVYQAPEQVQGARELTPSCDLYSLAAIMYETLTGQPPFPTKLKLPEMIDAICNQPVAPPRSINPLLPDELDAFLLRALDKRPERRFQSAEEFERAMNAIENPSK